MDEGGVRRLTRYLYRICTTRHITDGRFEVLNFIILRFCISALADEL